MNNCENEATAYINNVIKPIEKERDKIIKLLSSKNIINIINKNNYISLLNKYDDLLFEKYNYLGNLISYEEE